MAVGFQVTFDCADPDRMAQFWASALGYQPEPPPEGFDSWESWAVDAGIPESEWNNAAAIVDPDGHGSRLFFQKVPEGKTAKNRVHLDVNVGGGRGTPPEQRREAAQAACRRLVEAGGQFEREVDEPGGWCLVMRDVEGNEFCLQ